MSRFFTSQATALSSSLAALILISASVQNLFAQENSPPVAVEQIADGLDHPWSVEVLPDGRFLVSERSGGLNVISQDGAAQSVEGLPALYVGGQGGLLDLALDPDFADNGNIYFTASISGKGGQGTALFRAQLNLQSERLEDVSRLFAMNRFSSTSRHFGARITVSNAGNLFFGIGDRGDSERAQDPEDHAGSIIRLTTEGAVPDDNPFVDSGDGEAEIWSIGHRNPQGITIDPANGTLFTVEHGARGGDEINIPRSGHNYGWPVISYGVHYSGAKIGVGTEAPGLDQPVYYWDPSIAPGAIAVYRGDMFPEWDGDFLVAALKDQLLVRVVRNQAGAIIGEQRFFENEFGRLRDVKVAPDGAVLLLTDEDNGKLLRVYRGQEGN